jgi:chromosome segregation ATPase
MSQTRLDIEKIRSNWREKKRQQLRNPMVLEKHRNASREYQRKRLQTIQQLQKNDEELQQKTEKLEKIIESQNEHIAALTLQNFRLISEVERITQICNSLQAQLQKPPIDCEAVVNEWLKNQYLSHRII